MLLSMFHTAVVMSYVGYPYRISVCATGLSSVNHVHCRDARYAAFRRFERPRAYLLLSMKLRQFGTPVALRMLYPKLVLAGAVVTLLLPLVRKALRNCPRDIEMGKSHSIRSQETRDGIRWCHQSRSILLVCR